MSSEYTPGYCNSIPMATSGSSAAEETPESEHALSVLDFAQQYAVGAQRQVRLLLLCRDSLLNTVLLMCIIICVALLQIGCPRSSRRKRRRDGPCQDEEQPPSQSCTQQQRQQPAHGRTVQQFHSTAVSTESTSAAACQKTSQTTYYVALYTCLMQWCCRLKALQPKCIITKDVLHRSLDLFHRYRQVLTADPSTQRRGATAVHLAACLWIASKNDGNRACVPSRTLLTRAISVCPEELSQAELTVCCKLRWNIFNSQVASAFQY